MLCNLVPCDLSKGAEILDRFWGCKNTVRQEGGHFVEVHSEEVPHEEGLSKMDEQTMSEGSTEEEEEED